MDLGPRARFYFHFVFIAIFLQTDYSIESPDKDFTLIYTYISMSSSWVAVIHPESGATYYTNVHTFETSWTPPPDFVDNGGGYYGHDGAESYSADGAYAAAGEEGAYDAESYSSQGQGAEAESYDAHASSADYSSEPQQEYAYDYNSTANIATSMWAEYMDEASGAPFYVNQLTGVTQWEKPEGFGETAQAEADPSEVAANWTENIDDASQLPYYVNLVTGESRWEKPSCLSYAVQTAESHPLDAAGSHTTEQPASSSSSEPADFIPDAGPVSITPSFTGRKTFAAEKSKSPSKAQQSEVDSFDLTKLEAMKKKGDKKLSLFETVAEEPAIPEPGPAKAPADASVPAETRSASISEPAPEPITKVPSIDGSAAATANPVVTSNSSSSNSSAPSIPVASTGPADAAPPPPHVKVDKTTIEAGRAAAAMLKDSPPTLHSLIIGRRSTADLIAMCDNCSMEAYGNKFFNFDRKGIFGRKTTIEKLLTWKDELIKTSLKVLPQEATTMAVQLYRNVTGFTGDRTSGKPLMDHSLKILRNMLPASDDLRDELYCQIIKQTRGNPSVESTENGWLLMLVCLSTFPPSPMLKLDMMAYCALNISRPEKRIGMLAEMCLHCIPKICESGPRRDVPSKMELESLLRAEPCNLRVYFADNRFIQTFVHSWMLAADLIVAIRGHMGIPSDSKRVYALFETNHKDEERTVDDDDLVLEIVADWEKLILSSTQSERSIRASMSHLHQITIDTKPPFYLVFKLLLFPSTNEVPESIEVELEYVQAVSDVINARYPCSELDALSLGALQLQEQYGDHPGGNECKYVQGKIATYVSRRFFELNRAKEEELERRLLQLYSKLSGYSQQEARLCYLDYVKAWRTYGCTFFIVEPLNNKDLPDQVVLSIGVRGITIIDPVSKEYCAEYRHENVLSWGNSATSVVLAVGNQVKHNKLYFKSLQSKEINQLLKQYAEYRGANI